MWVGIFFASKGAEASNCQNFHTMKPFKQSLCRPWSHPVVWLAWLCCVWALGASPLWAQTSRPAQPPVASAPPAQTPEARLHQSVQQWVARQQSVSPDQVVLAPLDARLKIQPCAQPLVMDLPFASPETVRVRCTEPAWQLYVRVQKIIADQTPPAARPAAAVAVAEARRPVVVTTMALSRGMAVQASDIKLQEVALTPGGGPYLDHPSEAMHAEILRDVPAGTPLRRNDLRPIIVVKRGQLVQLTIGQNKGFSISARVEALQDGRMGEHIRLKNPESGKILSGVVRGPNVVEGL